MSNELKILRMNILGGFDTYVREHVDDEDLIDYWLMDGVPDCCDEETLEFIATDEECWLACVNAFSYICKEIGVI